jgi:hypothetical protein
MTHNQRKRTMPTQKDQQEALNRAVELTKEFIQAGSKESPDKILRSIFDTLIGILKDIEASND